MPLNPTFTPPRTFPVSAKSGGGFESEGLVSVPPSGGFTPLLADDFLTGTAGNTVSTAPSSTWYDGRVTYDQTRAFSGSQSMKVTMQSADGVTCGGLHSYGGKVTLPTFVPKGKNIWLRFKMYIPSTFSWGYVYAGSDSAAASACGNSSDGFGRHKFIVFDQDGGTGRLYLQPHGDRRSVSRVPGLTIDTDVGAFGALDANYLIPVDQWFDIQIHLYVDDTSSGFYRVWSDGVYKGQVDGPTLSNAAATISKVGIGDYWNGIHYTDGQAGRSEFWVDEMLVASDVDGYGAPTGTDAGGRPFIDPATLIGDL